MNEAAKEKIVVALDVADADQAVGILGELEGVGVWCKVGMQLFTAAGPDVVREARSKGWRVFLDLKFHDIPNTVASGVTSARALGVDMLTIHLGGGPGMVRRAVEAAGEDLLLLGVTVLTSSTRADLEAVGTPHEPSDLVPQLAAMGLEEGLRGVVCSPLELGVIRGRFADRLRTVTPGVRPAGAELGDQRRVMTPGDAVRAGADWLVIGRPIIGAGDRRGAFEQIADEVAAAMPRRA